MMLNFFNSAAKKADGSLYQDLFYKSPAGLCILTHPDFEIRIANESFAKVFSLTKHDIVGKLFVCVWKKCEKRDEFFMRMRKEGNVEGFEYDGILFSGAVLDDENYLISAVKLP